MTRRVASALVLLALLIAIPAAATTVVVGTDAALFDQAPLVVEGTVLAAAPAKDRPATDYRVRIERTVKGATASAVVVLRVLGGKAADGTRLTIWGAPVFGVGERALLFLVPRADGTFVPLHLALGAFHEVRVAGGRRIAIRDLRDMVDVSKGSGDDASDSPRDAERFTAWLADRAAGWRRPADYQVSLPPSALHGDAEKFTYLLNVKQRWPDFDAGQSVSWRSRPSGQPGLADGGLAEMAAAIAAWNGVADTNVRYRYAGTTTASGGLRTADGVNTFLFDDPNGEVGGTFTCSSPGNGSGVIAIGGTWSHPGSGGVEVITEGDVVTNDGVGCWFASPARAAQIFAHELGHSLGLGHSCGDSRSPSCSDPRLDQAVMRARAHLDERGAALDADDQAGVRYLYPASGFPTLPAAPTGLTATPLSTSSIRLSWQDQASNESEFVLQGSGPNGALALTAPVAANTATIDVADLAATTPYTFRVIARNAAGDSAASNEASATTLGLVPGPCSSAPANLCLQGDRFRVSVRWRTSAGDGSGTAVPLSDQSGMFWFFGADNLELVVKMIDGRTVNDFYWTYYGGLSDQEYWVTVTDTRSDASKTYHNDAGSLCGLGDVDAFAGGGSSPVVAAIAGERQARLATSCPAGTLCLLGGRFQATVTWRVPSGQTGLGTPAGLTDVSGLFWFFAPANVELVVKVIDARLVNDRFWVYYGALSDVQYDLTVTDTTTGVARTYHNAQGNHCGNADTGTFPGH